MSDDFKPADLPNLPADGIEMACGDGDAESSNDRYNKKRLRALADREEGKL